MRANRSEMRYYVWKKKKNAIAYGIIGLGRFGEALATELARSGAELFVSGSRRRKRVREMRELTENALVVNTLDKKTLTETGIQNFAILRSSASASIWNPLS